MDYEGFRLRSFIFQKRQKLRQQTLKDEEIMRKKQEELEEFLKS